MEFLSKELQNASTVSSSITHVDKQEFDIKNLRNLLRSFILEKDVNLIDVYDIAVFNKKISSSGIENLQILLESIRSNSLEKFKNDKERQIIINLMFDNIISCLKTLKTINTDCSSNEINTLILGFLIKNFI